MAVKWLKHTVIRLCVGLIRFGSVLRLQWLGLDFMLCECESCISIRYFHCYCQIHKSGILNPTHGESIASLWRHDLYLIAEDKHRIQFVFFPLSLLFFLLTSLRRSWNPLQPLCRCHFGMILPERRKGAAIYIVLTSIFQHVWWSSTTMAWFSAFTPNDSLKGSSNGSMLNPISL